MDRTSFLEKLFRMYPSSFNEFNIKDWFDAYEQVLASPRINYDKLFTLMIKTWTSTTVAPHPQWFETNISNVIEKDDKCAAVRHIEEIQRTSEPIPEHVKIRMEELKRKMTLRALW